MWKKSLLGFTMLMGLYLLSPTNIFADQRNMNEFKKATGHEAIRKTRYGLLKGYQHAKDTWGWVGIPFAKPPVGNLRWKAPQPPEPWNGVRDATHPDRVDVCTQIKTNRYWTPEKDKAGKPVIEGSEDCLYLNVFAPKKAHQLPVYVYIHGGSNKNGSAKDSFAATLAEKNNVVFVAVSYRLGSLGWFYHPAAQNNDNAADNSGNYGNLDNIQALKWVKENIQSFGGDPDNVTIAGESAGAHDVIVLMASPLAKGLFHRAHIESHGMKNDKNGVITYTPEVGKQLADKLLAGLLVLDGTAADNEVASEILAKKSNKQIAAYTASKTGKEIIQAMFASGYPLYEAVVDGYVLPKDYFELFNEGNYNKVPVILGTNEYEVKPFMRYWGPWLGPWDKLFYRVLLDDLPLDEVIDENGKKLYEVCGKWGGLNWRAKHLDELATVLAKQQDNVYGYFFKWGGVGSGPKPFDLIIGAGHAFDIPFWQGWDTGFFDVSFQPENERGRKATQAAMTGFLAQFAKTGNPNRKDDQLLDWKSWSNVEGGPKALEIDSNFKDVLLNMSTEKVTFEMVKEGLATEIKTLPQDVAGSPYQFQWFVPYIPPEKR